MKPAVLIILDGWGIASGGPGNAISQASLPTYHRLLASFPHANLLASGEAVGLPRGERGNSETGHLNIGAGRIVYQDLPRINMSIADGTFFRNEAFLKGVEHTKKFNSKLHIMGLIGEGGIHSSNEHLFALLNLVSNLKKDNIFLHLFTDGRDSPPTSALSYLNQVNENIKKFGIGEIATIAGRYYSMDRDNRWERTEKAYRAMILGTGQTANSPEEAIINSYNKGQTDEFIEPTVILNTNKNPKTVISENDACIFFNYRIDRPRQLTKAFVLDDLDSAIPKKPYFDPYGEKYLHKNIVEVPPINKTFNRGEKIKNLLFVTMTEYEKGLPALVAFPPIKLTMTLSKVFFMQGMNQLHISETEKERFVTYYFDGMNEQKCPREDWVSIPSKKVATYDQKPEMSAREITSFANSEINKENYGFILINFANPDMVGHTGIIQAGILACETIDNCLELLVTNILSHNGYCFITSDHGNVEEMINLGSGAVDTEHSTNQVPFVIIGKEYQNNPKQLLSGALCDVGPTILKVLGIPKPADFTGRSLI